MAIAVGQRTVKAIYCDGSGTQKSPAGWGVVIYSEDDSVLEIGGYEDNSTNQRAELLAAIHALKFLSENPQSGLVPVFSDSEYVCNGYTQQWVQTRWQQNGWLTAEGKAVQNRDLWEQLEALRSDSVRFLHMRGHTDRAGANGEARRAENYERYGRDSFLHNAGNQRADTVAGLCRKIRQSIRRKGDCFEIYQATSLKANQTDRLIGELASIDDDIVERLTPTYHKFPVRSNWNKEPYLGEDRLIELLKYGDSLPQKNGDGFYTQEYDGYAIRLGEGLIACDFDGKSALALGQALAKDNGGMPETPMWKGARGKSALYWLPDDLVEEIGALPSSIDKIKVKKHGDISTVGTEAIELLYEGKTATIPPSYHPKLDNGYQWIISFQQLDFGIAPAPKWVVDLFRAEVDRRKSFLNRPVSIQSGDLNVETANQLLNRIDPDDYDVWIRVGLSLKTAFDEEGLDVWINWSQTSAKYKPGDCDRRWDGFEANRIPVDYLYRVAGVPVPGSDTRYSKEPDPDEYKAYQSAQADWELSEELQALFYLPESDLQEIFQAPILAKLNEQRKTIVATAKSAVEEIAKTVFPGQYAEHEAALGRRLSGVEKRKIRSDWTKSQIQQHIEANYPDFDQVTFTGDELRQYVLALSAEKGLKSIIEYHSQWQQRKREEWQRQKYREAARGQWEKTKSYTPDRTINARFVSDEITLKTILDSNAHIFGLKAGMGTGKTHALAKILKQWDSGAMAIGYRNSLLLQSCERWGNFYHLRDDDASSLLADPNARIAFCIDSILKAKPEDCRGKIIILDESTSIIKHGLFSSTLGDRRGQILEHFEQCIKEAAVILAWDGRNADIYINYLAALRGENARAVKFYNEATATKLDVEIVRSVGRAGVCHQDYGAVLGQIDSVLTDIWSATAINDSGDVRTSVVIISDSQTLCESMDRKLSGMGYRVLRIDSKTIRDEQIKEILKNPDAYLTDHPEIDVLILSPTAESGIDVSIKNRFACGFAFFFGVVDTDSQMQFMRRVRDCTRWSVHIPEYLTRDDEGLKSPFAQQLTKELLDYLEKDAAAAIEGGDQESLAAEYQASLKQTINTEHAKTYLKLRAARNYEKSALQECLKECLERDGHTVNVVEVARDDAAAESYKEAKLEVLQEEAQAIFYADIEECGDDWDAKVQWAIDQRSRFGASLADERRAQKIMLLHQIPGITETPFWTWELVYRLKFDDRSLLTKLRRWWLLHHMDVAKQQAGDRWQAVIENGRFIGDIKSDYRYLQAIDRIGIPTLCDAELHNGSEELIEIHTRVKRSKNLQVALRRSAGKSPVALANALARSVGMTIEDKQGSTRGDRKRYYTYASPESDALLSTLLDCLNTKFNLLQQKRQEKIDREAELNASANSSASSFDEGMSQSNVVALRQPQVIQSPVSVAHSPPRTVEDAQVVTMVKPFPCSPIVPGEYTVSKRNGDGMVKLLVNGEEYPIWIAPAFFSNIEHQQEVKVG